MNKLLALSLTALVAGAVTLPASARDDGRRHSQSSQHSQQRDHDRHRGQDRRGDRRDWQRGNDSRQAQHRRDDRRDWQRGNDHRQVQHRRDDRRAPIHHAPRREVHHHHHVSRPAVVHHHHHYRSDPRYRASHRYRAPARYHHPRGYYVSSWHVGHRLPPAYWGPTYRVDYHYYRLPPPPRGHHWVRIDNDVVLVALASGLIASVLYDLFY